MNVSRGVNIWVWLGALEWWPHSQNKGPNARRTRPLFSPPKGPKDDEVIDVGVPHFANVPNPWTCPNKNDERQRSLQANV